MRKFLLLESPQSPTPAAGCQDHSKPYYYVKFRTFLVKVITLNSKAVSQFRFCGLHQNNTFFSQVRIISSGYVSFPKALVALYGFVDLSLESSIIYRSLEQIRHYSFFNLKYLYIFGSPPFGRLPSELADFRLIGPLYSLIVVVASINSMINDTDKCVYDLKKSFVVTDDRSPCSPSSQQSLSDAFQEASGQPESGTCSPRLGRGPPPSSTSTRSTPSVSSGDPYYKTLWIPFYAN